MELYTEDQVKEFMMLAIIQDKVRLLAESVNSLSNKYKEFTNENIGGSIKESCEVKTSASM